MKPDFGELDLRIAQARVVLSLLAMLSLYVDPSVAGGLFHLDKWAFITLICYLIYSSLVYMALSLGGVQIDSLRRVSTALDLLFATAVAFLTEGRTSPSFVFFVFAIVAVGFRSSLRDTLLATSCSVALYILIIALSGGLMSVYVMRAVYLAIAGYLIAFFAQQRVAFEARLRELEARAAMEAIARSLHDGYIQALAGISLRLESCRDMLISNQPPEALAEIREIQIVVAREYDEVREYVRSLTTVDRQTTNQPPVDFNTQFRLDAAFEGRGAIIEHVIQIVLEGVRNTRRHGHARLAAIKVQQAGGTILIRIDDDGVGFADCINPPWTIASRVAESGGRLTINPDSPGAHLDIAIPVA